MCIYACMYVFVLYVGTHYFRSATKYSGLIEEDKLQYCETYPTRQNFH